MGQNTRAFVDSQHGRLRLFFLPPYSPHRNPDELVWKHLKADTVGRMTITDKADFKVKVRASMRQLQNNPEKIRSFTKNHRSNMPPEGAFTYGLINSWSSPRATIVVPRTQSEFTNEGASFLEGPLVTPVALPSPEPIPSLPSQHLCMFGQD